MIPEAGLPEEPALVVPVRIYFYDTDAGGVVHNVAYLRLIEQARSELAAFMGWDLKAMLSEGASCPVVARTEIDYLKPAKLGDQLDIHGSLIRMEKVRFHLAFTVRRAADGVMICQAKQVMVTVNLSSGRPQPLRRDWLERWPHLAK